MPFKYKELLIQIENLEKAGDRAWVFVVGCGPVSALCPESTQHPTTLQREIPIDFHADPQEILDFLVLKRALQLKLQELEAFEQGFGVGAINKLKELEKQLEGQEIEQLSRAFEERARDRKSGQS